MNQVYQDYLSSSIIRKIDNISLRAKLVVEGFIIGLHQSPYHGFSVEFSEHRPYGFGDEIKHIDWKLLAKTDKLYIKQFEEETNLKSYILFDKSASMGYSSKDNINKFEYAKTLSASLSYLMIRQQDAVGLTTFDDKINTSIIPRSKISHLNVLLNSLHKSKIGGETQISPILHSLAESIKKSFGMADLVTGSNAFAHNDNPEILIKAASCILKHEGLFCLEVMYAGDLLEMLQWDTLYHEHLTFYCLKTITFLLNNYGFY